MKPYIHIAVLFLGLLLPVTTFAQDLPVIGITEIHASINSRHWQDYKNSKQTNFQNMLETQLFKTGRFKIIERNRIDEVLAEQGIQGSFSGAGTKLQVQAVDYIVYGSITKFGSKKKILSTKNFSQAQLITEFGVDLKVVDAHSGEVRKTENIETIMESGTATGTKGFSTGDTAADPLADIQRVAARKVAAAIAESIFPIEVITFRDSTAYVNYGNALLSVGERLKVIQPGEALVDEKTGLNLGAVEEVIGVIEVTETLEKFSKARLVSGTPPQKGQIARIVGKGIGSAQSHSVAPGNQREYLGKKL